MIELPEQAHMFIFGLVKHMGDPVHYRKIIAIVYKGEAKTAVTLTI